MKPMWSKKYDECQNPECTTPGSNHQVKGLCEGCHSNLRYKSEARQEYQREYYKKYYKNNKKLSTKRIRWWWKDSPKKAREKARERTRAWQKNNPEKCRANTARRKSRKLNNGGDHTGEDVKFLLNLAKYRCLKCRKVLNLQIDHIVPLANGGYNGISNLQVLCGPCNLSKGSRNSNDYRSEEFMQVVVEWERACEGIPT